MKQAATLFLPLLLMTPGLSLTSPGVQHPVTEAPHTIEAPTEANLTLTPEEKDELAHGHIPAESLYQLLAAELALDRDHPEIALANYIAAAKETQDPAIAARATQVALTLASLEIAVEPAQIWAKTDPKNLEAQITTAALFIRLDQVPNAIPYLRQSEQINPDEALQYFLILFRQLQKEEDSKRVVSALTLLAKEETTTMSAHLALTEIYLYLGENRLALEMSKEAIEHTPHAVTAVQLYAESLIRNDGKTAAKEYLDKTVKNNPNDATIRQYYAQFLVEQGYDKEAHQQIAHLLKNPKLTSQELLQFARLCMQAQWFDLAEKTLLRASAFPESKDLSYYFLARVAEMQNHDDVAIEWFKQVLTGPFHVLSQIRASVLLSDKKQYDEALTILSHTQPNDNGDGKQIILATVEVLNKANRYPESLQLLDENIKTMPDDIELHYARSLVADRLNKTELAESDLKAILAIQPNHLDALNALGYLLANKTKRYDEAKNYLTQALQLSPENPSVLDSIGWLYYKMGNYQQSIQMLKKAVEITPDAEIAAHLGEVLWQAKDFEEAKKVWRNALEHHPKHENILNAMQRLMPEKN